MTYEEWLERRRARWWGLSVVEDYILGAVYAVASWLARRKR